MRLTRVGPRLVGLRQDRRRQAAVAPALILTTSFTSNNLASVFFQAQTASSYNVGKLQICLPCRFGE